MDGTLFVIALFVIRLGVPAFIILGIGEMIRRHSANLQAGGD